MKRRLATTSLAALIIAAGACQTGSTTPTTSTSATPTPEQARRIPVADEQGEPVGYLLESDIEARQSEADGGRVPVYDEDTSELVGYFEIGPDGGYEPLDE